jgi:hypothetical protein
VTRGCRDNLPGSIAAGCTSAFVGRRRGWKTSIGGFGKIVLSCGEWLGGAKDSPSFWRAIMDDRQVALREKLDCLLREAAEVEVELSRAEGAIVGIPHYSVIESRAHELGRRLSRRVQQRQMGETAARGPRRAKCPGCGTICELSECKREITSIDGGFELLELKGHCPSCRRDFFPSSGDTGV